MGEQSGLHPNETHYKVLAKTRNWPKITHRLCHRPEFLKIELATGKQAVKFHVNRL